MKLKIAVCDDENIMISRLKNELLHLRPNYMIDAYSSGGSLLDAKYAYDIIFLDIEMPGLDGMETAKRLRALNKNAHIIFLTSHTEYMPEAFKVRAFRFLGKPLCAKELKEAVGEIEKEMLDEYISVTDEKRDSVTIRYKDIFCFEAYGDGTYIYTTRGVIDTKNTLKYWCDIVGQEHFCQVHKSYVVPFRHVGVISNNNVTIDGLDKTIPIARRRLKDFKELYVRYLENYARTL